MTWMELASYWGTVTASGTMEKGPSRGRDPCEPRTRYKGWLSVENGPRNARLRARITARSAGQIPYKPHHWKWSFHGGRGRPRVGSHPRPRGRTRSERSDRDAAPGPPVPAAPEEDWALRFRYLLAEFDNYRRRTDRERERIGRENRALVLRELLPFNDAIEKANLAGRQLPPDHPLRLGFDLLLREWDRFLATERFEPVARVGEPFRAEVQEAIGEVPATPERPDGIVAEIVQQGYRCAGGLLRPAKVLVARRPSGPRPGEGQRSTRARSGGGVGSMERSSEISGFYRLSIEARREKLREWAGLSAAELDRLRPAHRAGPDAGRPHGGERRGDLPGPARDRDELPDQRTGLPDPDGHGGAERGRRGLELRQGGRARPAGSGRRAPPRS